MLAGLLAAVGYAPQTHSQPRCRPVPRRAVLTCEEPASGRERYVPSWVKRDAAAQNIYAEARSEYEEYARILEARESGKSDEATRDPSPPAASPTPASVPQSAVIAAHAFSYPATAAAAAIDGLRYDGFAVLPTSLVPSQVVEDAREAVRTRLDQLLAAVDDAGCDVVEQQYSFAEICHRKRLRWDLKMPPCEEWAALERHVVAEAVPLLHELSATALGCGEAAPVPRIIMSGAVVSRPGAGPQSFHADGTGRLLNVFVPLVDIAPETDGTQFWPGSHLNAAAPDRAPSLADDAEAMATMTSPGCPAGGMLAFDYRVVHRGLSNERRERAVAYFVVALEPDSRDAHNFPPMSVHDAAAAESAATMPFWSDEVGRLVSVQRTRRDGVLRRLAQARGIALEAAKATVRGSCEAQGLDPSSLQVQESVARALLLE